jgi:hypothetical protein
LIETFVNNLLPIFIVIGVGVILNRTLKPDVKSLSTISFYLFVPALIFSGLVRSDVTGEERGQIAAFALLAAAAMFALGWLIARALHWPEKRQRALLLCVVLMNTANFALPVIESAFGAEAEARAMIYVAVNASLAGSFGVAIAAGGGDLREMAGRLLKIPLLYATVIAIVLNILGVELSDQLMRPIDLAAGAGIPVMLLVLGIQLDQSAAELRGHLPLILTASITRLVIGPILAMAALAPITGVTGAAYAASVMETSMPTSVTSVVLAVQYDLEPDGVAGTVFFSTLASALTLSVLIGILS